MERVISVTIMDTIRFVDNSLLLADITQIFRKTFHINPQPYVLNHRFYSDDAATNPHYITLPLIVDLNRLRPFFG